MLFPPKQEEKEERGKKKIREEKPILSQKLDFDFILFLWYNGTYRLRIRVL